MANALRTAHRMGINGLNRGLNFYGLSLVLGGGEVSLLDHTYAYSVLANSGNMVGEPRRSDADPERLPHAGPGVDPAGARQRRQHAQEVRGSHRPTASSAPKSPT